MPSGRMSAEPTVHIRRYTHCVKVSLFLCVVFVGTLNNFDAKKSQLTFENV